MRFDRFVSGHRFSDAKRRTSTAPSGAALSARAKTAAFFCAVLFLFARPALAADLALLRNGFTIRHDHHQVVGANTRLYLGADDSSFTEVPTADITGYEKDLSLFAPPDSAAASAPTPFEATRSAPAKRATNLNEVVNGASATYHLDPDLVNSVIHAESGFNSHAVSPKGARGLMQLMPGTASQLGVHDAFDPQANVDGGSRYLRELLERYNFDIVKALAAYNAGPQRVEQYRGVPPFRETRAYVARIVHEYNKKKIAQEKIEKQKTAPEKPANVVAKKSAIKNPTHAQLASKSASAPNETQQARP